MGALVVHPASGPLCGTFTVPGDKSIAHRALLLGALASGTTVVEGFPGGEDVRATLGAVRILGADASWSGDVVRIEGAGRTLGAAGTRIIDCRNSGTTMRLGAGLAAGGGATVTFDGDVSLRRRPMERVAEPLRRMGAHVVTTDGHAPLAVRGGTLTAIDWPMPVASAQIKSAVLLAGLRARGTTRVHEPLPSRDHTERLLGAMGVRVRREGATVSVDGMRTLQPVTVPLPGDLSSAAFLVVAALLVPGSELHLRDVGTNPTRTGALDILRRMGAAIEIRDEREVAGEPRGDLVVHGARLHGTVITPAEVPAAIDELPVLAVAAALADGTTRLTGAAELRVKESDRIAGIAQLTTMGVGVETSADGFVIQGTGGRRLTGASIRTGGDHRIAMAFGVAGLVANDGVEIDDPACAEVSFPGFFARLAALGARVEETTCNE
jgi:3-phosphoshikimate 1-carboxyvinyltransferase